MYIINTVNCFAAAITECGYLNCKIPGVCIRMCRFCVISVAPSPKFIAMHQRRNRYTGKINWRSGAGANEEQN